LVVALFFILFAPHSAVFLSCEGTNHQFVMTRDNDLPIVERGPALASSLRREKGFEQTPLRFAQVAATQSRLPQRGILESKPESRVNHFVNSALGLRRKRPFLKPVWALSADFTDPAYSRAAEYLRIKRIRQMLIVDGQIHLWEKGTPSPPHRQEPYSRRRRSPRWMKPASTAR
jgi:hypothetical protein